MRLYDLHEMKRRLAEIDAEREPLVRLIEAAEAYEESAKGRLRVPEVSVQRNPPNPHGKTVLELTENVALQRIEETGRPVQTREVVEIMQNRGLPLPNKHVTNVISARLSNSDRLEGRRGLGWWPKGRPWPHEQPSFIHNGDAGSNRYSENGEAKASPEADGVGAPSNETPASSGA